MRAYKGKFQKGRSRRQRSAMPRLSTIVIAAAFGFFAANQGPGIVNRATETFAWASPEAALDRRQFTAHTHDTPSPSMISFDDTSPTTKERARGGAGTIIGHVERVADGDTFTVSGRKIRICGIDAPERDTAEGGRARAEMDRLVSGKTVSCTIVGYGTPCDGRSSSRSYDRDVAQCHVGGRDVAAEMVRRGHAEDWPKFSGGYYAR